MAAVFVHGLPETSRIWDSLRRILGHDSIALALPGFGTPRPAEFTATKDAYAEWLADALSGIEEPIDLVRLVRAHPETADTRRRGGVAEAPEAVAPVLQRFWSSVEE